jgi:hypothetical protein
MNTTFEGFSIKQKINKSRAAVTVVSGAVSFTNCKVRVEVVTSMLIGARAYVWLSKSVMKGRACPALNLMGRVVVASGCVFSESPGGSPKIKRAVVFLDSCKFEDCNVDVASGAVNVVSRGQSDGSQGWYRRCEKVDAFVWDMPITAGCIDARPNDR